MALLLAVGVAAVRIVAKTVGDERFAKLRTRLKPFGNTSYYNHYGIMAIKL